MVLVVSVSASHAVGIRFAPQLSHNQRQLYKWIKLPVCQLYEDKNNRYLFESIVRVGYCILALD